MNTDALGPGKDHSTRLLQPPDLPALQALFERAREYFEVATGAPPAKDEASRAFVAGPPTKSVDEKRIVGAFGPDGRLAGVIDSIVDWPAPGTWTVGMLLVDPASRGAGLGTAFLGAFEAWARANGAARIRTAVVSHHERGIRFAERRGYRPEASLDDYDAGARRAAVQFFDKPLVADEP